MLYYILFTVFIVSCLVLVVAVLLQPGKADAGALFTSSVSSTAFGPRGTQSILAKITIGAAASFMLIALLLSLPALNGPHSVIKAGAAQSKTGAPTPTPAAPASLPVAVPAGATPATVEVKPAVSPEAKKSPDQKKNK